jgi:hypothetical protein
MNLSEEFLKNIDLENCDWAHDPIKSFRNEEGEKLEKYRDFVTEREEKNQRVAIASIVGTEHQDYPMRAWIWIIAFGKRMNFALQDYKKNPQYYFLKERPRRVSENLHYSTVNGKDFYISDDGNHRTTIAKFVLWQAKEKYLYDVDVKYHDINYDFYDAYQELKSFCKNTPKFDTYSELKDNVSSVVVINEFNNDRLRLYNENEIKDFLSQENSISSKIKRFLGC